MQVDKIAAPTTPNTAPITEQLRPTPSYQSSISSLQRPVLKAASPIQVFFEDLFGFTLNFFFWPIHGPLIMSQQILLMIMLPIVFPFLILEVIIKIALTILNICSCPLIQEIFGPAFNPREPSAEEAQQLKPWVRPNASVSENQQLQLLHLLNTYFDFANSYKLDIRGKENDHYNVLIKVDIDSASQLFQYTPNRNKSFSSYIDFIVATAKPGSTIRFTFVGLDHSYFIGMLKMKVKTDVVKFLVSDEGLQLEAQESGKPKSTFASIKSYIFGFFSRILPLRASIYDLQQENDQRAVDFSLWPGTTRRLCADLINNSLRGAHLSEYHITLLDLENLIRS